MKDCINLKKNMQVCNCTFEPCERKGRCCECIAYHRSLRQFPGCFFPSRYEKTYDRSLDNLLLAYKQ
ncbi:MAG: hypothetical protein FJZ16_02335 [Candidatus Omnitrophica bacterium]|nr:hypothetical protein [Candidatus Omnitrophota bacterium]